MTTPALHKSWARQLITAVGGVEAAGAITGTCASTASRWQNGALVMSAMHIAALQTAAQTALYSDALSALVAAPNSSNSPDPLPHAADAAREAACLPALVIAAQVDGRIDERERRALIETIAAARAELDRAEHALCAEQARAAE